MRVRFADVMFWIFLIIAGVLVLWRLFGNSLGIDAVLVSIIGGIIFMIMGQGERLTKLEMSMRHGFVMVKKDMGLIKKDMSLIKERLEI